MRDCFPYLNHTNLQGRNMLDMRRMKKFQKEKAEIQKRLAALKEKIADTENEDEIVEALQNYQEKLRAAMTLKKADFEGEGAEDFKFGFKMPLNCVNDTNCEWICQKMIKSDGISEEAIESDQNVKVEDLEQDADQQFESDLVVVDDSEDDDEEMPADNSTDVNPPIKPTRRMLADAVTEVVYDVNGYTADDDTFEAGVVVDEPSMAENLVVPEDQVDENNSSSSNTVTYIMYAVGGLVILITLVGAVMHINKKKENEYTHDQQQTQMTQSVVTN